MGEAFPLEVDGLVKSYGDVHAVKGVSFRVRRGTVFCLLGPNGAGKTTTLEACQGLLRPTSGTIRLLGDDPQRLSMPVRKRIGVLPQHFLAFNTLTVRENLEYFADVYGVKPDIPALLDSMGLTGDADKRYQKLSGGTKRRVGILAALVNDPDLVFLDEPTAGVDPASRRKLWDVIDRLKAQGRAIVLTTHYMDEAERLSDEVAIMSQGRIIASGTPERVRLEHGGKTIVRLTGLSGPLPVSLATRPGVVVDKEGVASLPLENVAEGPEVLAELRRSGVTFREVSIREPTLDDAFVRLVQEAA